MDFKFILKKGYLSSLKEILADYRDAIKIYEVADLDEIAKERKKVTEGLDEISSMMDMHGNHPLHHGISVDSAVHHPQT